MGRWGDSNINVCYIWPETGVSQIDSWECNNRSLDIGDILSDPTWDFSNMPSGSEVGILMDLDEGKMSIYSNGQRVGVLKSGLAGEYCWSVHLSSITHPSLFTVSITRGDVPTD